MSHDDINKKDWIFLGILTFIFIVIQLSLYNGCCLNNDSYYYKNFDTVDYDKGIVGSYLPNIITVFGSTITIYLIGIVSLFSIILFYAIARNWFTEKISFIISLMFMIDPLNFFNTQLGILDKNPLILFLFLGLFYCLYVCKGNKIFRWIMVCVVAALSMLVWNGYIAIYIIIFTIVFIHAFLKKEYIYSTAFLFLTLFFFATNFMMFNNLASGIGSGNKVLLGETRYAFELFSGMYFFYVLVIITALILIKKLLFKEHNIIFIGLFVTLIPFIYMFRFNLFFVPFVYLMLGFLIDDKKVFRNILIFFVICIVISYPFYFREPRHNNSMLSAMELINQQNTTCLINEWGSGHVYQYFTNKTVKFKAHTRIDQLDYLAYGNISHNCSIIYEKGDIFILQKMINITGAEKVDTLYIETLAYDYFIDIKRHKEYRVVTWLQ